uniref:Reverse transcriptase domain-containing protein n=1 Tax=Triticum urartu TaxID=4572 RepID=A0A8R7RBY6_TRIUA
MKTVSPVQLDFEEMEVQVTLKSGEKKIFKDESLPSEPVQEMDSMEHLSDDTICGAVLLLNRIALTEHEDTVVPPPVQELLGQYKDIFGTPTDLPPKRNVDHAIPFEPGAKVINQRPYRLPYHQKEVMENIIQEMIKNKVIRDSSSPYSSPAILVKKKDLSWGLCNDFRKVNTQTIKNKYPIPVIEDLLDELHGATVFTKLDLRSGYHQIRMKEEDIEKTAFSTHCGHYEYLVMPFGLTNAPATFQMLMNTILAKYLRKFVLVFFDDILVFSKNMKEHIIHLQQVFETLKEHHLYIKASKCVFAQPQVEYLGHVIRADGVATDPVKIQAVQ